MTVTGNSPVIVYWRPGCFYCAGLRRRLRRLGVHTTEVNIWEDPAGAAAVRSYAGGNETVPAVVIGDTAMVNPTGPDVLEASRRLAPRAVRDSGPLVALPRSWPSPAAVATWTVVVVAAAAGIVARAAGNQALSSVAVCFCLAARVLRRQIRPVGVAVVNSGATDHHSALSAAPFQIHGAATGRDLTR